MKSFRFYLAAIFLLLLKSATAQYSVSGRIVDAVTKEPLAGASVYCQNTTIGTTTNKEGQFSLSLKSGGYDLIISYTGYTTKYVRIQHTDTQLADIEMEQEEKSLGEVIITSSNEVKDGWEKYGDFFLDHFLGATPNADQTEIINPEAIKFYFIKRTNKLRVLATEPIQIDNHALGYRLSYQLDSFIYLYDTDINSYRGYCFFTPMEGNDSLQAIWNENRKLAYYGSKLHFMRSYYDTTLTQDGWLIDMLMENEKQKFYRITRPYDSEYYEHIDSIGQAEIWFPRKISVIYTKAKPDPTYLQQHKLPKDVSIQISYIDIQEPVRIMENGYYYEQRNWINQGYWSWKNIGDLLPYDYIP